MQDTVSGLVLQTPISTGEGETSTAHGYTGRDDAVEKPATNAFALRWLGRALPRLRRVEFE